MAQMPMRSARRVTGRGRSRIRGKALIALIGAAAVAVTILTAAPGTASTSASSVSADATGVAFSLVAPTVQGRLMIDSVVDTRCAWGKLRGWSMFRADTPVKTTDGGQTWQRATVPPGIGSAWFLNRRYGWYLTSELNPRYTTRTRTWYARFRLYRTTDGGASWRWLWTKNDLAGLHQRCFVDARYGWFKGSRQVWKTTDGGRTLRDLKIHRFAAVRQSRIALSGVHFVSRRVGWAYGGILPIGNNPDLLLKTTDGGRTWRRQKTGRRGGIDELSFVNASVGYLVNPRTVMRTANGGRTWRTLRRGSIFYERVHALDARRVVVTGSQYRSDGMLGTGMVFTSTDRGLTWDAFVPHARYAGRIDPAAGNLTPGLQGRRGAVWVGPFRWQGSDSEGNHTDCNVILKSPPDVTAATPSR